MERKDGEEHRKEDFPYRVLFLYPSFPSWRQTECVCVLTDKRSTHLSNKVTPCLLLSPRDCILYMTSGWKMWSEIFTSMCVCVCVCDAHVRGVRMIQSAISLCEDSLHKHTHHAEDVVILRLIVCVSDVSNRHQTRGGFTLPLSLSFPVAASDCTNCPVLLLLPLLLVILLQLAKGMTCWKQSFYWPFGWN